MSGTSPPPPPQAARALVRQLFSRRAGGPEVTATLSEDPGSSPGTLEFVNESGEALGLAGRCRTELGMRDFDVGHLPAQSNASVTVGPVPRDFECVWSCTDARGRAYVWSYDGPRRRLRPWEPRDLPALFARTYGAG